MAKSDSEDAFAIQYRMLKLTALWPEEHPSVWYKVRSALVYILCFNFGLTMVLEAANDVHDFAKLSEILYIMISIIVHLLKYASLLFQRKAFIHMIKLLRDPVFTSYADELDILMSKRIASSQRFVNLYRFFVLTFMFLVAGSPFFDNKPLPFPFPYDLGDYWFFMYVFQVVGMGLVAWNNSCIDTLAACLMGVASTQLDILVQKIITVKSAEDETNPSAVHEGLLVDNLKQCVRHHLAIIEYIECIDRVFSFGILSQFLGSGVVICNTVFHLVLVPVGSSQFFMLFNYFALIIGQLFMYCWFGNDVILKSINVGEACYLFDWYNYSCEAREYLFLIMERSKRPLRITAYKFSTLSLTSFSTIMRWSYSYFALLMKLYTKTKSN